MFISNPLRMAMLVCLNPHDEAQIVQRLRDHVGNTASVQIWHLPKAKLDSRSNIFNAAVLAHREGLSSILIADGFDEASAEGRPTPG